MQPKLEGIFIKVHGNATEEAKNLHSAPHFRLSKYEYQSWAKTEDGQLRSDGSDCSPEVGPRKYSPIWGRPTISDPFWAQSRRGLHPLFDAIAGCRAR